MFDSGFVSCTLAVGSVFNRLRHHLGASVMDLPPPAAQQSLNLMSLRAHKARWGAKIGHTGHQALITGAGLFAILGAIIFLLGPSRFGALSGSLAFLCFAIAEWYRLDL